VAVTLAEPVDTADSAPRIVVKVGGVESFEPVVLLLRRAGVFGMGGRRFEARPPLAAGQVDALRELDGFGGGSVTVTVEPAGADVWRADPWAPEIVVDDDSHEHLRWWQRNRRAPRAGALSVEAGTAVPLETGVPFTVEVSEPAGRHAVAYRFDGQVCAVTVDGQVNVVGNADLKEGKFTSEYVAGDGRRTIVVLRTTGD
jgi:hypothetical protein